MITVDAVPPRLRSKFVVDEATGCWLWTAAMGKGYGLVLWPPRSYRQTGAHRAVWLATGGTIPTGFDLDHLCRVPRCVNPAHLEPVTRRENLIRGQGLTARALWTHCAAGHPFDEVNTRMVRGRRLCRACDKRRKREYYERLRHPDCEQVVE